MERRYSFFAVIGLKRDWVEETLALYVPHHETEAIGHAAIIAAYENDRYIRCRIKPIELTRKQVEAMVEQWGMDDRLHGEAMERRWLPGEWGAMYQKGYDSL